MAKEKEKNLINYRIYRNLDIRSDGEILTKPDYAIARTSAYLTRVGYSSEDASKIMNQVSGVVISNQEQATRRLFALNNIMVASCEIGAAAILCEKIPLLLDAPIMMPIGVSAICVAFLSVSAGCIMKAINYAVRGNRNHNPYNNKAINLNPEYKEALQVYYQSLQDAPKLPTVKQLKRNSSNIDW